MSILAFDQSFPSILKTSIEEKLHKEVTVGMPFKSADSFSYLIEIESEKYVAKIYRFEDWPPVGKLQTIEAILDAHNILHEKYQFIEHTHPIFKYGWSLSVFIPGGAIRDLRENGSLNKKEYYQKIGRILRQIHNIQLQQYGALQQDGSKFKSFHLYAAHEIQEQDYQDLPSSFPDTYKIL